ncbi:radical SAM/SPASM domain-containing protein [Brachyspira intermedia]|uniref:radical SAM/SPASM domain-containing protein n=1 Tax=Brachyspira intermedia TaxID=84377 RepID=UPI0030065E8E
MSTKIIDKIVWWIPFKNLRNSIRDLLNTNYNKICNIENKISNIENKIYNDSEILMKEKYKSLINKTANLLIYQKNEEIKKEMFKKNVYLVEIGISSYCNRKCWFCPNFIIDRKSKVIELDEKLFLKLIMELKEIDYSGIINLHRYNEPLYNKELLIKRIKQINEYIPNSKIRIFTNGDYLDIEYLETLRNLNVNYILISYYYDSLDMNTPFDIENIIKPGMDKLINKLKLNYNVIISTDNEYYLKLEYKDMEIFYKAQNFKNIATPRGNTIKNITLTKRVMQCFMPVVSIQVDYDGNYTPCCELRSDIEEHKKYILGNIETDTIFDIYTNKKMADFRKDIFTIGDKKSVCYNCRQDEYNMPEYF